MARLLCITTSGLVALYLSTVTCVVSCKLHGHAVAAVSQEGGDPKEERCGKQGMHSPATAVHRVFDIELVERQVVDDLLAPWVRNEVLPAHGCDCIVGVGRIKLSAIHSGGEQSE
jgi:hypothetical protein